MNWQLTAMLSPLSQTPSGHPQNASFSANCTRRGLLTVAFTTPHVVGELKSPPGFANCAWLKRLKNSARKSKRIVSRIGKCLITEKSVFTKSGPETGARLAFPSSPAGGVAKQV